MGGRGHSLLPVEKEHRKPLDADLRQEELINAEPSRS